jgi:hypothetical protein
LAGQSGYALTAKAPIFRKAVKGLQTRATANTVLVAFIACRARGCHSTAFSSASYQR